MHKSIDVDATEILQAAKINAEADGHAFQSEEYFRALVDELLRWLDDANEPTRVRPLLYAPLDDVLDGSSSLVLVDIDCIDYVCHALADETNEARFALVPPAAEKVKSYSKLPIVDLDEYEEKFDIRGRAIVSKEEWATLIEELSTFAGMLSSCLGEYSDRFVGLIADEGDLKDAIGDGSFSQVRVADFPLDSNAPHDPISVIQRADPFVKYASTLGAKCISAIIWEGNAGDRGFDCSDMKELPYGFSSMDVHHLREVIELPKDYQCQLFIWDSSHDGYSDQVRMSAIDDNGRAEDVAVFAAELDEKLVYSPSYYINRKGDVYGVALKDLVKRIGRGTTLKGKDLEIIGDVRDERGVQEGPGSWVFLQGGAPWGYYTAYESYYIDNASIVPDELGSVVMARIIEKIPEGQDRYTLRPEDGTVILMPRNGKGVACYTATGPTLISNNLFIIWPNTDKVDPEYLAIAMRSRIVSSQIDPKKGVLGKSDIASMVIPMASRDEMAAVVDRDRKIHDEIEAISSQLNQLRNENPLESIWLQADARNASSDNGNGATEE